MEVRQDVFDAVRNAVLAGRHVIAAAGNGSQDLDAPVHQRLFDRTFRDSGSILVGATDGALLVRAGFSNYGSIVDANGWGYRVYTTGYGDLFQPGGDKRQSYTSAFSGTSSATPIVTGAAIALLGALREQKGRSLTSLELRNLLRAHGTDVPNGRIGRRPDLKLLLAAEGLPAGLDLATEGDLGTAFSAELTAPPGSPYALVAALDRGFLDLGAAGRYLLDLATTQPIAAGTVGATGRVPFSAQIPNDINLRKQSLYLQAGWIEGGNLRLSNSVVNYIP
jgi:subtilisin family serine protease